ncbi:class I SAM-dependent methyltransferase [Pseudonocardia endophytica]|uniref:Methyltransferase family protein n=1 Tax=Pseudonocardia endophytica TaxID=401976 RepID=A0A4R1I2C2_PSEEN|nr:class I SAM-dependent methyltransferase [Pseudonocardia endophytica]TCK26639.1 methyltransferase family protein [Pseudonocardia endophytica]
MTDVEWHRNRARAESFGAGAADYDRYRPPYADGLFDDLASRRPDRVLDIGCGNGRAAVGLIARGLDVLGVEPDTRMAEVARSRGVVVEIAPFEDWDDDGRRFDLLTCGSAWHWVEPARGVAKAAAVLRPGGTLARFWNYHVLDDATVERLERVYADLGVEAGGHGRGARAYDSDPVVADPAFGEVTTEIWREARTFTADGWIDLLGTFSDHATLDPDRRTELFAALRREIDAMGGTLRATACTHLLRSTRV